MAGCCTTCPLNHPHIGAIYGIEESDGITALVLELVEGPTLADRLERGPLPLAGALAIARQIAGALEAAHELANAVAEVSRCSRFFPGCCRGGDGSQKQWGEPGPGLAVHAFVVEQRVPVSNPVPQAGGGP